jgi:hypothetical protein
MKIVKHQIGLRFGSFTDIYEILTNCSRETAVQRFLDFFSRHGVTNIGRAYDGAWLFDLSPRHEVAVYFREGQIKIEDRFKTWIWLRLCPSWLRRHLPSVIGLLCNDARKTKA